VDLDEVHAATGIRPRYLQAIEQEDWDALPEEFYARSFLRKYAQFLELDPEPLVQEYRRQRGGGERGDAPTSPFARTRSRRAAALRRRRKRQGVYAWVGTGAVLVAIVVVIVVVLSGGGEEGGAKPGKGDGAATKAKKSAKGEGATPKKQAAAGPHTGASKSSDGVALKVEPTAEVWTCVLDHKGKPLIAGLTLDEGETMGPFHSRSYTAAFGNGSVRLLVDGKVVKTPDTPSPIGVAVDADGKVHELAEGKRPSCE
jgi:cytoskeletal protein RodZ